ncbi:MAG TPA: TadE/TadG family type IV pilus assembly protein [Pyrinomonadaceae bacterium]
MNRQQPHRAGERGATLLEFVITATVYFMMLIGIVAISHLYFTHNALVESTRRGARYATFNLTSTDAQIKEVVVYGMSPPAAGAQPLVVGLTTDDVEVTRTNFGVAQGTVTVYIDGYQYNLVSPVISSLITMPEYRTTLPGESAGYMP